MRKQEQGISVVGFLIVCAVLAALLVGGIYAYRKVSAGGSTTTKDGTKVATQQASANGSTNSASSNPSGSVKSTTNSSNGTSSTGSANSTPDTQSSPVAQTGTGTTYTNGTGNTSQSSTPQPAATDNSNLPHTGPSDVVEQIVGIGFVTAAGVAYTASRRKSASL